jgi:hypothetical protein
MRSLAAAQAIVQAASAQDKAQLVRSSTGGVQSQPVVDMASLELVDKPIRELTDRELMVSTMNRGCGPLS